MGYAFLSTEGLNIKKHDEKKKKNIKINKDI